MKLAAREKSNPDLPAEKERGAELNTDDNLDLPEKLPAVRPGQAAKKSGAKGGK
jgi:hypothetical protein